MTHLRSSEEQYLPSNLIEHLFKVLNIKLLSLIGEGLTSYVYRVQKINTNGQQYALKVYNLQKNDKNIRKDRLKMQYEMQVRVLKMMQNEKRVIKIYEHGIYEDFAYIVMQLMLGGSMGDICSKLYIQTLHKLNNENTQQKAYIIENKRKKLLEIEKITKNLLGQLVLILQKLQDYGIIHRDLKFQNLLLDHHFLLTITDFGTIQISENLFQQSLWKNQYLPLLQLNHQLNFKNQFLVGSKHYISPELISGKKNRIISNKIDIWSFGVIAYRMFCGHFPFQPDECTRNSQYYHKISTIQPQFPHYLHQSQKQLLSLCLQKNPNNRPNAKGIQKLAYFKQIQWQSFYHHLYFNFAQDTKQLQFNNINTYTLAKNKSQIIFQLTNDKVKYYRHKQKKKQKYQELSSYTNLSEDSEHQHLKHRQPVNNRSKKCKSVHLIVEEDEQVGRVLKVIKKSELGVVKLTCLKMKELKIKKFNDRQVKIQRNKQDNDQSSEEFELLFSNADHLEDFISLFKNNQETR